MNAGPLFTQAQECQPLRDYQGRAVDGVRGKWDAGVRSVCLVAPTGSGKTRMGEELVHHELERGGSVLWMAHRRELLRQARDRLRRSLGYLEVGAVAPGEEWMPAARVQVATVQTLLARDHRPPASLLVFDEAHHYVSDDWRALARAYPDARAVGLTATPERGDGRPLGDVFDDLVVAAQYSELLAAGYLVPVRLFDPGEVISDGLAQDVVTAYQRYTSGTSAFAFMRSVAEARDTALRFRRYGWSAGVIEANTPAGERDELLARFRAGQLCVLCSVATLTEGVDVPEASTCILARSVGHVSTYLQMVGRVLRPAPGKAEATVLDLVGAWRAHGLPTEDREYTLGGEGGIVRKSATAVTQCLRCGAVSAAHVRVCPLCGWERPARELAAQKVYDKPLTEIAPHAPAAGASKATPEEVYADLRARQQGEGQSLEWLVGEFIRRFGRRPDLADVTRSERLAEWERLRSVAAIASRKGDWVDRKYRAIFGELPNTTSLVTDRIAGRIAALGGSR